AGGIVTRVVAVDQGIRRELIGVPAVGGADGGTHLTRRQVHHMPLGAAFKDALLHGIAIHGPGRDGIDAILGYLKVGVEGVEAAGTGVVLRGRSGFRVGLAVVGRTHDTHVV